MCCIFTCCGWMIDLIQRLWTFTMSCCISSAVCCVLIIASMSGIALGYNYSLAEYIDLKETNVSIFLKRGIFDDEISDVEWRRSGHQPVKGQLDENNLRTGAPSGESSPIQSGRRLDDSVFETGDQNRYEGSLMKLTAKPPFPSTTPHWITGDTDMAAIASSYTRDSLDSLKAVQSVIDARKSMANRYAGATTLTPVPTYPFREPEHMYQGGGRRLLPHYDYKASINPARLAVPDKGIGSRMNWVAPKHPELFKKQLKNYGLESVSLTYPSPITWNTGPIRPTPTHTPMPGRDSLFLTRDMPFTLFSTAPTEAEVLTLATEKSAPEEPLRERVVMEDVVPPKRKNRPKTEEDYDYEIKGLPVRKRRSIKSESKDQDHRKYTTGLNTEMVKDPKTSVGKVLQNTLVNQNLDTSNKTDKVQSDNRGKIDDFNKQTNIDQKSSTTIAEVILQSLKTEQTLSSHKDLTKINKQASNENKLFAHIRSNLKVIKTFFESIQFTNPFAAKDTNIENNDVTESSNSLIVSKIISSASFSRSSTRDSFSTKYIIID